jgi:hypothetical protein
MNQAPGEQLLNRRILDPLDRTSEVLFGLIMVMTFTGAIRVADSGEGEIRELLVGAVSCSVAWGLVDAVMYVMSNFMRRARGLALLRAIRDSHPVLARKLVREGMNPFLTTVLTEDDERLLIERLEAVRSPERHVRITGADLIGGVGVFLLVFLSTLPVVMPFGLISRPVFAWHTSNAIALAMLFLLGWSLGRYAGRSGARVGVGMMLLGGALVVIAIALGG